MRILFDALGAPSSSGGMRSYVEQLVAAWAGAHQDEIHVAGERWILDSLHMIPKQNLHVLPAQGMGRVGSQWFRVGRLARSIDADLVHSMSPVVSPWVGQNAVRSNTIHDWRHLLRPAEFSLTQRTYRRLWTTMTSSVAFSVQISEKTAGETRAFVPGARLVVAVNGSDHAHRWQPVGRGSRLDEVQLLTFGHHANKRPDMVIRALPKLIANSSQRVQLTVLGAEGSIASELEGLASTLQVSGNVHFPGFVLESEYRRRLQQASVVILASTDEGYGLPVAEAACFGIPVVATRDNGVAGIHRWPVINVDPDPDALANGVTTAMRMCLAPGLSGQTWAETAGTIREQAILRVRGPIQ